MRNSGFSSSPRSQGDGMAEYLSAIASVAIPNDEEVASLIHTVRNRAAGRESRLAARNRLVEGNLRLVVSVARAYCGMGLTLDDLIAEGNIGLMRAVKGYDPTLQVRFSSYAPYWIRAAIRQAVSRQARQVRLPDYMHWLLRRYEKARAELTDRLGRKPTVDEIRKELSLSPTRAQFLSDALVTAEACRPPTSGGGPDEPSDRRLPPDEAASNRDGVVWLKTLMRRLPGRHARVLRRRLGDDKALAAIGTELGVTRERVRQIESEALAMIRAAAGGESVFAAAKAVRADRKRKPNSPPRASTIESEAAL